MIENVKKYKSYIIVTIIIVLIIIVFIAKQINGDSGDNCIDPNCNEHAHTENNSVGIYEPDYKVYNFTSNFCVYCTDMKPIYDKCKIEYKDKLRI